MDQKTSLWYIVEVIERFKMYSDDEPYTTYINSILVNASTKQDAYDKALQIGSEFDRPNEANIFYGIRDIKKIVSDKLIDGSVLYQPEPPRIATEYELESLIRSRENLNVFEPRLDIHTGEKKPSFIPKDSVWYLAEYVHKTIDEDSSKFKVMFTFGLIYAKLPEEAYLKAIEQGKNLTASEASRTGYQGLKFHGLRQLTVIDDPVLEHGTEIIYEDWNKAPDEEIERMRREKDELSIFKSN